MTPVYVPTKPYIKAWLEMNVPNGIVDRYNMVGSILLPLLDTTTDRRATTDVSYTAVATLYVRPDAAMRHGGWLNVTQTMMFNNSVGKVIRDQALEIVLTYMEFNPRLKLAIEYAQARMRLGEDVLPYDNVKKSFQRYRKKHGGPTIYQPRKVVSLDN